MAVPVRTCVGCRARVPADQLVRVVARDGIAVPDLGRRLPGRGAHLHPRLACLELAGRRRALPRSLRVDWSLDLAPLRASIAELDQPGGGSDGG
ncbi:MAG: YlxR family protein [Actinomycetes bacterium]